MFVSMHNLWMKIQDSVLENKMLMTMIKLVQGPWMQALFLYTIGWWATPLFALFSMINKTVRDLRGITD